MAQTIKSSKPTAKQIKRATDATRLGRYHVDNMLRPVIIAAQPWASPLPFDINVPLIPYI